MLSEGPEGLVFDVSAAALGGCGLVEAWLRERGVIEAEVRQGRWFFRGVIAEWLLKDVSTVELMIAAYEHR